MLFINLQFSVVFVTVEVLFIRESCFIILVTILVQRKISLAVCVNTPPDVSLILCRRLVR